MSVTSAKTNWVPIVGQFRSIEGELHYLGRRVPPAPPSDSTAEPPNRQASAGLALSNLTLGDGDVWADVSFKGISNETECQIAISYDANAAKLVTVGIGGATWSLFCISERGGPKNPKGWWAHQLGGDRGILDEVSAYRLHAEFRGASVRLSINDVEVAGADVMSPVGELRQIGVFCRADEGAEVIVRNFRVESVKPKAFMVMQFGSDYDSVYSDVVKEVCKDYELKALRADEVSGPGLIISDIIREINESHLIIADISSANPNVYFEVGYGLALGKPTILLARRDTKLPFDVAAYRVLFYEDTIGGKARLEEGLRRHLNAILERP